MIDPTILVGEKRMVVIEGKIISKVKIIPIIGKQIRYVVMKKNSSQKLQIIADESDVDFPEGKEIKIVIE